MPQKPVISQAPAPPVLFYSYCFASSLEINQDAIVKETELSESSRSRSSTAPAIIAEKEGGLTIDFGGENLAIHASIPINMDEEGTGMYEELSSNVDSEVQEIMNDSSPTLDVVIDIDPIEHYSSTGETGLQSWLLQ